MLRNFKLLKGGNSVNALTPRNAALELAKKIYNKTKQSSFEILMKESKKKKNYKYLAKINKDGKIHLKSGGAEGEEAEGDKCKKDGCDITNMGQDFDYIQNNDLNTKIQSINKLNKIIDITQNEFIKDFTNNIFDKVKKEAIDLDNAYVKDYIHNIASDIFNKIIVNNKERENLVKLQKDLPTIINRHELVLNNKTKTFSNCNFAVVTYWWGNKNLNKNFLSSCLNEEPTMNSTMNAAYTNYRKTHGNKPEGKNFEDMIKDWAETCIKEKCNFIVEEYPEFTIPKGYQVAINAKPLFIKKALETARIAGLKGVVYIDGDMSVNKFPDIFNTENVDFMARGWNMDPRSSDSYLEGYMTFDPWVFETSGGIMYFGDTPGGHAILDAWIKATNRPSFAGKADDRIISLIFNIANMFQRYNIIQLPIEYLWLTDIYGTRHNGTDKIIKKLNNPAKNTGFIIEKDAGPVIIEHPACLTSEERARDQGADENREPTSYERYITSAINLDKLYDEKYTFYDYIFFDEKTHADGYQKYNIFMSNSEIVWHVPYDSCYADYNQIVIENLISLNEKIKEVPTNIGNAAKAKAEALKAIAEALKAVAANTEKTAAVEALKGVGIKTKEVNDVAKTLNAAAKETKNTAKAALIKEKEALYTAGETFENIYTVPIAKYLESFEILTKGTDYEKINTITRTLSNNAATKTQKFFLIYENSKYNNSSRILKKLIEGTNVVFIPRKCNFQKSTCADNTINELVIDFLENFDKTTEFAAYIRTKSLKRLRPKIHDFNPQFDFSYPMYFSCNSKILRHLLLMSSSISKRSFKDIENYNYVNKKYIDGTKSIPTDFNSIFNSSYIFFTRIRCSFLES
jgi:hypothetical protein